MAVLGPGSDRPAAVRPAAQRRTVADSFFAFREECRHFAAGEKSRRSRCGKAIEAKPSLGPDPSIRGCVGARPSNRPMETTMAAIIVAAQGYGITGRTKTCACASTKGEGVTQRTTAHDFAWRRRRPRRLRVRPRRVELAISMSQVGDR